jgi:glycosyltransferase involved in cell wall biosynthesis
LKRILYIQYTNPAGYPPLEHSSRILADAGWQVLFLGTGAVGADALRFPPHPNVRVRCLEFCCPGWRQKLHYFYFCAWTLAWTLLWRPSWIYASDPLVCPAALALCSLPWLRVLYHEHDSPDGPADGGFQRLVRWARKQVARRAACSVLPNDARRQRFKVETGTRQEVFCVWNCPASPEVAPQRTPADGAFWLLYHGSIVPDRLPLAVVDALAALPDRVKLRVIGYETVGWAGYVEQLRERAKQLGIGHRLEIIGAMSRFELVERCQQCDAGLALVPLTTGDVNHQAMTGASNKAFDYLACGLAILVSDLPDWRALYVEPGYGIPCDPQDAESIARSVRRLADDPALTRSMGERGRQRILNEWNYERCFQPVLRRLQAPQNKLADRSPAGDRVGGKVADTQL